MNANISENNITAPEVPYIVHESIMTRQERMIKRLWVLVIALIAVVFVTNAIWLLEFTSYDFETYVVESKDGGNANYIGNDGTINNGIDTSAENEEEIGIEQG